MDAAAAGDGVTPAAPRDEGLRPLDPRVRTLWWLAGALGALPQVAVLLVVDLVAPHSLPTGVITAAGLVVIVALTIAVPLLRYRRWRYGLRPDALWIRQGVVFVTTTVIPYRRLQFVDTRQGPFERMLGLAELIVHTASPGTSGQLVGLDAAEAERLREELARVTAADEAV